MSRFYRTLAKVVTIYAFLHPFVYIGALWIDSGNMGDEFASGWTAASMEVEEGDMRFSANGTPLLYQHLIFESAFSVRHVLLALVMSLGLLAAGAIFHIAANSRPQLADADARDLQRPAGDTDAG